MKNYLKIIFLIVCTFCATYCCTAQWYNPDKVNKKAADLYAAAYNDAQEGNYKAAIDKVDKAIALDNKFVDAYLTKAGIFANEKKYDSSIIHFAKAFQLDSIYCNTYLLPYSISLAGAGKFDEALHAINIFLANSTLNVYSKKAANYRKSVYEFAVDYQKKHPNNNYVFAPKNLGDSINSIYAEYYPSLTIDGKKLIFTKRYKADEDFYESTLHAREWSANKPLEGKVNTNFNEGAQSISQDGEWIVFTGCLFPEGYGSCDLYIAYKNNKNYTEAINLGGMVNTEFWESAPSISPDKRDIYFSSAKPGGYGGKDIWVTHRNEKGKWGKPENLGPTVNTNADESCAFMYADNQTLFFNSNGHIGYGSTDLFFSKKNADNTWTEPTNLGYPINTIDDEGSMVVAADGKTAYYASERSDTRGALDLYSFELRYDIRPPRTLWIKGKVFDVKTKNGLPCSIELIEKSTGRLISKVQTNEDGNYLTTLPVGNNYYYSVNRKGYLFFSENYDIGSNNVDSFFTADIPLQPIEPGAAIVLKNIFFDTKKTVLKNESLIELNKVIQLMVDNTALKILISGYTDNVGTLKDNTTLSTGRAMAVATYLLSSKLIAKERIKYKGFGALKPIASNTTEIGKASNRRTELSVISN